MTTHSTPSARRAPWLGRLTACAATAAMGVTAFGLAAPASAADAPAPTAHYDMSHTGATLTDVSGNGRNATLVGLTDDSFVDAAGDDVLRFQKDGYATLPKGLVTGTDNAFTVEYTVTTQTAANQFGWVIGDGIGNWNTTQLGDHVFLNPMSADGAYSRQVLSGIRVKVDGNNGETRLPAGGGLQPGFTTLTMVGDGNRLTLYRDGAQISTVTHTKQLSDIVPDGDVLGYLGRSLYAPDGLLDADVTDVKFWDAALSADEVTASMPDAGAKAASTDALLRLDLAGLIVGENASLDAVLNDLTLPASVNGVGVTWASSNLDVVSATGEVSRTITEDAVVQLTATTASGSVIVIEVTVLAPDVSNDLDAISLAERSTEHFPLVTEGSVNGARITWTSSDESLVTSTDPDYEAPAVGAADPYQGGGLVTRPAYGEGDREVTLTATATLGENTATREFQVAVAEHGRTAPDAGYAAAYFRSDSDEKIYQAATTGNDFFSFVPVNGGKVVIESTTDERGLRDPYILRSHDGDKYYMVATDLCIGCGTGWGPAQSQGSLKIEVWESTDLVHWDRTNGENTGITVNQPEAGMTWAPEAYWDDDLQAYVVFFASRLYSDATHSNSNDLYARMFAVITRDFKTFTSPPLTWQDTGFARIDSTVTKIGDYYYRFTKNEEGGAADGLEAGKDIFMERSKVLTAPTERSDWNADPETTWQLTDTRMTSLETGQAGEGPEIVKLNEGDPNNTAENDGYVFLVDNYGAGGYRAFVTDEDAIASSSQSDRLSKRADWNVRPAGGLPASPRHGAFVSVNQQVLDAMHAWSAVEAVESATSLTVADGVAAAQVTAADGGDVVGTVTFTDGTWSETVTLKGGAASAELPAGVGAVTASYNGYRDGLVAASESAPVASSTITAVGTTRCVAGKIVAVVTVRNDGDAAVDATIRMSYGSKAVTVGAGKGVSAAFSTRQTSIGADTAVVSTADGEVEAEIAAASCQ